MRRKVLALSERGEYGILFDGVLKADPGEEESLAVCVMRMLRERGIYLHPGDVLFFPNASRGNRTCLVNGYLSVQRLYGGPT